MSAALFAFLGFALLVILHELGHFAAAKAVGMRVERFALFFPPLLGRVKFGETEYAIGSIPLGGYVKITGMNPEEELSPELKARSYSGSPVWKRIVVIAAGPAVNLVVAFLLLGAIFWYQGKPVPGVSVGQVEQGLASEGQLQRKDTILSVGAAGAGAAKLVSGNEPGMTRAQADKASLALRDLIATGGCGAKPGTQCATPPQAFEVTVLRDGVTKTVEVTPQYDKALKRYRLGIGFGDSYQSVGAAEAAGLSLTGMGNVTKATVSMLGKIVYDPESRKEVSSVVGGYEATRQSFSVDTIQALTILALISLSLAIINLLPILPLDGGHIFWALVEKARGGKPVSTVVLERATIVGFGLVMLLFAVGFSNDMGRILSGEGFGIR